MLKNCVFGSHTALRCFFKCSHRGVYALLFKTSAPCLRPKLLFFSPLQVVKGKLTIKLKDRDINLNEGQFFIIPRGVEHLPVAEEECHVLLFEPKTVLNTGNVKNEKTVESLVFI